MAVAEAIKQGYELYPSITVTDATTVARLGLFLESLGHPNCVLNKSVLYVDVADQATLDSAFAAFDFAGAAAAAKWAAVRGQRDSLLTACDWTQVADAPVDKAAWADYRKALRDLPQTQDDPSNIVWPVEPA